MNIMHVDFSQLSDGIVHTLAYPVIFMSIAANLAKLLQALKIKKYQKGGTVSLSYWVIAFISGAYWVVYGVVIFDLAIMISSSVGITATSTILIAYTYYEKKEKK
jgi:uncharacterized protein with PQ loop repeat